MVRTRLLLAIVAGLSVGCSIFNEELSSDVDKPVQNAAVNPVEGDIIAVEVPASTNPLKVPEYRPIDLPASRASTTIESFEFGGDAPLVENARSVRAKAVINNRPTRFAPSYPERPIPKRGMQKHEVLAAAGEPANRMPGSASEVWDYGTYRVFFSGEKVAFTRVW